MSYQDCLIWVGHSYPTIQDYLHEVKARGCCRKVPFWPAWARRGSTRVFLAHHDGMTAPDRGVIFGYYVLTGVDLVLASADYDELTAILAGCRDAGLGRHALGDGEKGLHCAETMADFWHRRAPDDPLPFRLKDWQGDLDTFAGFFRDLFVPADGDALGASALVLSTALTRLEEPRLCPVDGLRTSPDKSGRPSFYFVDALARLIDLRFEARPHGRGEYGRALEEAAALLEDVAPAPATLRACERRCGAMVTFKAPYPFYRSIPYASFRGLVQIDGDALLKQVEKVSRYRSKCHEVKLPYAVEKSDPGASKHKEELIVDMSVDLKLSKSYAERVLDWLPEMMADELRARSVIRLPNVGTFRLKSAAADAEGDGDPSHDARAEADIQFAPSRAFEREFGEIEFTPSRGLARRI
jgi:hypothetical protein